MKANKPLLLEVKDLNIGFETPEGEFKAVQSISFNVRKGEILGVVGESGSGKSVTALSIIGLLPKWSSKVDGEIKFQVEGNEKLDHQTLREKGFESIRGSQIGFIFQDPMSSLNPAFTCGSQVSEALIKREGLNKMAAKARTIDLFEKVKLNDPERMFQAFPHQISGGQKQRVVIAMAISRDPKLLIADEATTALDVTVQKSVLKLIKELKDVLDIGVIFISHDLAVVSELADRVAVMRNGQIVEQGAVKEIFLNPKHSYTKGLLNCKPRLDLELDRLPTIQDFEKAELEDISQDTVLASFLKLKEGVNEKVNSNSQPLLKVRLLRKWYTAKKNWFGKPLGYVKAVDGIDFDIYAGESLGLVGESGSGKSTLGKLIVGLEEPDEGSIYFEGIHLNGKDNAEIKELGKPIQMIFQNPFSSLNPRMHIGSAIMEVVKLYNPQLPKSELREKAVELLNMVGLEESHFNRLPQEFSGGQRQRISIARVLAAEPKLIVCDESVSSLDVSVQAQILNLLKKLQEEKKLSYLFISHDLSVVRFMCDRIMVMKDGEIKESGITEDIFSNPKSSYTKTLIEAIPKGIV